MRELRTVLHQGMVGMSAAQGIYQLLDDRPVVDDVEPSPASSDGPLSPTVAFRDVTFRYPGTRRDVHQGLDFEVGAGQRIGIVGASGGGKSSIVRLLLRFYDPDRGTVRLGGHDLRQLSFDQIRSGLLGLQSFINRRVAGALLANTVFSEVIVEGILRDLPQPGSKALA